MKKHYVSAVIMGLSLLGFVGSASAATNADVAFVIDQSGSMGGEFAWLGSAIGGIDTALTAGGVTANYGVAGYEYNAGSDYSGNAWMDFTNDISAIISEVNSVSVYGGTERGYHAADWSANNFSWTGSSYAKVMILITDEPNDYTANYSYGGLTGETALDKMISDYNILLNVITFQGYFYKWDDAVYSTSTYQGLFDLDYLRTNPTGFTADFTAAKLREIQEYPTNEVPEPATMLLFGTGIAGLVASRRKRKDA